MDTESPNLRTCEKNKENKGSLFLHMGLGLQVVWAGGGGGGDDDTMTL